MASDTEGVIEALRDAIVQYGELYPQRVRRCTRGERVIQQGATSDVCFLIKSGTVSILVKDGATGSETEVALRYAREFIGETAFLQRGIPRTASVVVYSTDAELVSITRSDLYALLSQEPGLHDAIATLWDLSASRRRETLAVLGGKISVRTEMMSALFADAHNFSSLGEVVWEEEMDSLLFDFVELSSDTAQKHGGVFDDQGDGFKVLFSSSAHATRAVACAVEILELFRKLRAVKAAENSAFRKIGLGIGVCTDFMSIRRRDDSRSTGGRVLSHALNVAAAISKYREAVGETEVYVDEMTMKLARDPLLGFRGAEDIPLEKLGRRQTVYRAFSSPTLALLSGETSAPQTMPVGRAFVSYAHADIEFVDKLIGRLEFDGVTIWRDSTHILVGDDIDRAISQGIQDNRLFLIVLTHNSIKSDWVKQSQERRSCFL
jgi:class 3 adenylate cyclase